MEKNTILYSVAVVSSICAVCCCARFAWKKCSKPLKKMVDIELTEIQHKTMDNKDNSKEDNKEEDKEEDSKEDNKEEDKEDNKEDNKPIEFVVIKCYPKVIKYLIDNKADICSANREEDFTINIPEYVRCSVDVTNKYINELVNEYSERFALCIDDVRLKYNNFGTIDDIKKIKSDLKSL